MPAEPGVSGVCVLFVDDNEDARVIMKMVLELEGATVETAGSVAEAVARLSTVVPDVIITDLTMHPVDGFGFLEELKNSPAWRAIPVIAYTGVTGLEEHARAAGFTDVIIKPIEVDALIAVIVRVLEGRKPR
jgi:CheY-like chemotaxis protein